MKSINKLKPSLSERLQFIALGLLDLLLSLICLSYETFIYGFEKLSPRYLAWSSSKRARRAFYRAANNVPGYAKFITASGAKDIPETDKESYVKTFTPEQCCVYGRIPMTRTMIDESSGGTGTPYNWVRTLKERSDSQLFISYFATYCFGTEPWITINAFSTFFKTV